MSFIPISGGQALGRSIDFSYVVRRNCYAEISESENSKQRTSLIGTPGLELFATVTPTSGTESRGIYVTALDRLFVVVGDTLAEITSTGIVTNRGTLNTNNGPIKMIDNGVQLMIVDGTAGYIFTLATNTLTVIADVDFQNGATHVVFMDQYFIVNKINTNEFYISAQSDGTNWNALDFGTAEYAPDNIQSLATIRSNIVAFCDDTIEFFYNSGDADFPFKRVQGGLQEFGCLAKNSVAKINNSIFWVGSNRDGNRIIFKLNGYNAVRISTHDIEFELSKIDQIGDAVAHAYQQEGHYFYVLNFQQGNKTLVFDDTTGLWHERVSTSSAQIDSRARGQYSVLFNSKNYVTDFEDGKIYQYKLNHYTDNSDTIIRTFTLPHIHQERNFIYFDRIQLDIETGVGLVTGQGSKPQVKLRWSDDGGHNWSSSVLGSIGPIGKTGIRVVWRRLGRSRNRVFEFSLSDPVKFYVIGVDIDTRLGI